MSIPPIQGSGFSSTPPNDFLLNSLNQLLDAYKSAMSQYTNDPNASNLTNLKDTAQKLSTFLSKNKSEIEQECKANGWPAHNSTGGGYDDEIQGSINLANAIIDNPKLTPGEIMQFNENITNLTSMIGTKAH